MTRGQAELDTLGEVGDAQPTVTLEFDKDLPVSCVHARDSATQASWSAQYWEHFSSIRP
ncbi:hypothetical protein NOCA2360005 [metagenome]|uniref:Uncharacterized protein n=1 Tax=metagenome TaxID=256318 RepID=A0A2P2C3X5_9ZZZZ